MTILNSRLTNLNTAYTIIYSEFAKYVPTFLGTPALTDITTTTATISVVLNNFGWVFSMATKTNEDKGKPAS